MLKFVKNKYNKSNFKQILRMLLMSANKIKKEA
jgi:hypothetical protein